jgi:hypothetical protein
MAGVYYTAKGALRASRASAMEIKPGIRNWVQLILAIAILTAAARLILVYHERHRSFPQASKEEAPLNPEYLVSPRKLYAWDLKSARELTKQPVWVREGYKYTYYPYDRARRRSDFRHEAGTLGPIERLQIMDVVLDASPLAPDEREVMAVFDKGGKTYAFPIGVEHHGDYQIYSDEILYLQDPHQLYSFWPPEMWRAIDNHEVKPGMDELQASFAVGMGVLEKAPNPSERVLRYPNGGRPLRVTYHEGKAAQINPA